MSHPANVGHRCSETISSPYVNRESSEVQGGLVSLIDGAPLGRRKTQLAEGNNFRHGALMKFYIS